MRQRVREILRKALKWQLVPVRLDLETFEALRRIAPNGDVDSQPLPTGKGVLKFLIL